MIYPLWEIYSISKINGTRRIWSAFSITSLLRYGARIWQCRLRIHWSGTQQGNFSLFTWMKKRVDMAGWLYSWNPALDVPGSLHEWGFLTVKSATYHFLSDLCQHPNQPHCGKKLCFTKIHKSTMLQYVCCLLIFQSSPVVTCTWDKPKTCSNFQNPQLWGHTGTGWGVRKGWGGGGGRGIKTSDEPDLAKNMFNLSLMRVYLHVINLQNRKEQDIYTGVKQPKPVTAASSLKLLKRYQNS